MKNINGAPEGFQKYEVETAGEKLEYSFKAPRVLSERSRVFVYTHGLMSTEAWFQSPAALANDFILFIPRQPLVDVDDWKIWVENTHRIYLDAVERFELGQRELHGVSNCFGSLILFAWAQMKRPPLLSLSFSNPPLEIRRGPFRQGALKFLISRLFGNRVLFKSDLRNEDFFGEELPGFLEAHGVKYFSGNFMYQAQKMRDYFRKSGLRSSVRIQLLLSAQDRIADYAKILKRVAQLPQVHVKTFSGEHYVELLEGSDEFWSSVDQFAVHAARRQLRVAVVGMGAIGVPVAERFQQSGADVRGFGRTERDFSVIREGSAERRVSVRTASLRPSDLGQFDLVVFAMKNSALERDYQRYLSLLNPEGRALFLSNGLMEFHKLGFARPAQVLSGVVACSHLPEADGAIRIHKRAKIQVGTVSGEPLPRKLRELLERVEGLQIRGDIRELKWKKFQFSTWANPLTAVTQLTLRSLLSDPARAELALRMVGEVLQLKARVEGGLSGGERIKFWLLNTPLPRKLLARALGLVRGVFPDISTSMAHDRKLGRETEIESLLGLSLQLGRRHGLLLPAIEAVYKNFSQALPEEFSTESMAVLCPA